MSEATMKDILDAATAPKTLLKEGDIFRWRWTDEIAAKRQKDCGSTVYWCMSQIAVCKDGKLVDTFWGSSGSNYTLDMDRVVVTFLGNPSEMKVIPEAERVFYKPEDVVNMNHANNSRAPVYAKGERDPEIMKQYFQYKRDRFESDARFSLSRCEDCRQAIAAIEAGNTNFQFPVYF